MRTFAINGFSKLGLSPSIAAILMDIISLVMMLFVSYLVYFITKRIILTTLQKVIGKSKIAWDNIFLEHRLFHRLAHVTPALVIYLFCPLFFPEREVLVTLFQTAAFVYLVMMALFVLDALLDGVHDIYQTYDVSRQIPIKGFVQALKIIFFILGGIVIMSALTGKSPLVFFSGLGAMTAVLMLIFKDAILGFVAGIQLSANQMVQKGDWIEMPQFGADGDVLDVSLTTVKVQNWDKTITTIPTYSLISHSFKNWRGMQESEGRRIKRPLYIDMTSIKFCDEEMLVRFSRIQYIHDYIETKRQELAEYNKVKNVDNASLVNGRKLTNIGTFRAYVEAYLRHHPKIHQEMTFLVRQLNPTDHGLPLEIYVFSNDQVWARYEAIQADIFDHLFAALPNFDLRVFQNPTGADMRQMFK